MDYCILNDETIIENMIVCEDDTTAELFGAVPAYEGARTGDPYAPPSPAPPEPTAEDITLDMLADHEERLCMLEITTL